MTNGSYLHLCVNNISNFFRFVKEMARELEQVHGLKLCIPARDFTIGTAKYVITAKIIAERCRKVLIVMSKNFLEEQECDFQVRLSWRGVECCHCDIKGIPCKIIFFKLFFNWKYPYLHLLPECHNNLTTHIIIILCT